MKIQKRTIALCIYFGFLILPIYWMLNMSLRTNADILGDFALYPADITFQNYIKIFTDPTWYTAYINAIIYVSMNTAMSLAFALPAAYAFSRYKFLGDGQMFFWLLTNRMAPPAVFALPFFQLYSAIGLFDTHIAVALAHCLFNLPLAIWILEGFISGVPKELDETAYIDGYSFPRFFGRIFLPTIAAGSITFGILQQILTAFSQVSNSFQYLVNSWTTIVELLSVYKRLASFERSLKGKPLPEIDAKYEFGVSDK